MEFSARIFALWDALSASLTRVAPDLWLALQETLYMVSVSTFFSLIFGFSLATYMIIVGPHGLRPRSRVYFLLDICVNLFRSPPFIILIIALMDGTRFVMGTTIGTSAAIFPLTIAAIPFAARIIEGSFLEVNKGVIEAARSFGANRWQIILGVLLPEALPAIALNIAVLAITLLGYSAMAGAVGGGGLGDLAYRLGYQRFQTDVTYYCIVLLVILVQCIQFTGNLLYRKLR